MIELMLAVAVELSVGRTQFRQAEDGLWYQSEFDHSIDLNSTSWAVGIKYENWRFGYEHFGSVKSHALATASDEDYLNGAPYWPLSNWYGQGETRGIYLARQFDITDDFYAEVGAWVYRSSWLMTIPDWRACENCEPRHVQVKHNNGTQYNGLIGLGCRVTEQLDVSLTYRAVQNDGDQWPTIVRDYSPNLSVRFRF